MQLSSKEAKGKSLSPTETDLQKEVLKLVECSPCHHNTSGIFSWQIKSLKKFLENKVPTKCPESASLLIRMERVRQVENGFDYEHLCFASVWHEDRVECLSQYS